MESLIFFIYITFTAKSMVVLNSLSEFIYLDFICFVHFVGLAHLSLLCPILNSVRV